MTTEQLDKYKYWYDEQGVLWRRTSYFSMPSATFERVNKYPCNDYSMPEGSGEMTGGINSPLLLGLKPIEIEDLK